MEGIKNKGKEQKKTRIKSMNVFYPRSNETGANFQLDFLFRFEYKSPRICSPLFRLLFQEEKNIQRGNVIVTRRENDHDNKYALLPLIHPLFRSSLFLSDHWISRSIIVLKQTRDQNHFLDNFSKIFPPFGYFKREINLLLRCPLQ